MGFVIKKATKTAARGRVALIGPSGSGKTWTALSIAAALGQRVCVIDTERGSASKYSDRFDFSVLELDTFAPATYVEALKAVQGAGFDVIVVDSLSHAWMGKGGALEMVDAAAARSNSRNSFDAWRQITPQHNRLVDALLSCSAHLVVTMRSKTEYVIEEDARGKKVPRKVGLAPVQRDGLEYEFDVVGEMDHDHRLVVSKSRCSSLADAVIERPGADLGATLRAWLSDGPAEQPAEDPRAAETMPAPADAAPVPLTPLEIFLSNVADIELPGEGVAVWRMHRAELSHLVASDREAAWQALCARIEKVGKMHNAKVWLKKAIAEEDARRTEHGDDDPNRPRGGARPAAQQRTDAQGTGQDTAPAQGAQASADAWRDTADGIVQHVAAIGALRHLESSGRQHLRAVSDVLQLHAVHVYAGRLQQISHDGTSALAWDECVHRAETWLREGPRVAVLPSRPQARKIAAGGGR